MFAFITTVVCMAYGVTAASAAALGSYNVDPNSISVSGLSSGGYMAAQLGVAYSDIFTKGFGVFAGGPYDCARSQYVRWLMFQSNDTVVISDSAFLQTVHYLHVQRETIHYRSNLKHEIVEWKQDCGCEHA
jgi:poly(3-hydroxybutyrate) depolymerase